MSTNTETVATEPKTVKTPRTKKAKPHASRSAAKAEKLVCRYCGSNDLAPSFTRRRDARCRACLKKRYGSGGRDKEATHTRKAKAPEVASRTTSLGGLLEENPARYFLLGARGRFYPHEASPVARIPVRARVPIRKDRGVSTSS